MNAGNQAVSAYVSQARLLIIESFAKKNGVENSDLKLVKYDTEGQELRVDVHYDQFEPMSTHETLRIKY